VEVLLRIRRDAALVLGHRTEAAGLVGSNFSIRPPISSRPLWKTGVETASLLLVTSGSRHQTFPVAGSREVTDSPVQTISCLLPPAVTRVGELLVTDSSRAFQTSLPVSLSRAITHG
jgi:hypothetical protein